MKIKKTVLSLACCMYMTGCTNVVSSDHQVIGPLDGQDVEIHTIWTHANTFFSMADYGCQVSGEFERIRCARKLHNWIIHDTVVSIEIRNDTKDEGKFVMFASRRDEGLLPGDVLPDKYQNDDANDFCNYLVENKIAKCTAN